MPDTPKDLFHHDPRKRLRAVKAVIETADRSSLSELKECLGGEQNSYVAATIIHAIGLLGSSEDLYSIMHFLADRTPRVRANTVEAMARIGSTDTLTLLLPCLNDLNNRVRANAIVALKDRYPEIIIATVQSMAAEPDVRSKISAVYACREIGSEAAIAVLGDLARDEDNQVSGEAVSSLKKLEETGNIPAGKLLEELIADIELGAATDSFMALDDGSFIKLTPDLDVPSRNQSLVHSLRGEYDIQDDIDLGESPEAAGDTGDRQDGPDRRDRRTKLPGTRHSDDRYVIVNEVGRGGMGVILSVLDSDIRREVAMKVMTGGKGGTREHIERFVEEVQVQGQLEHPPICPVHELGLDNEGRMFFTMKMVKGLSLAEMIAKARHDPAAVKLGRLTEILGIFMKICDGMAFAHSRGVIHRDLKPHNVMVGDFGEVYVMDWGLARIIGREDDRTNELVITDRQESGDSVKTMSGSVVGTPAYMSPEQARGEIDGMDERTDIYSLGVVLYELLTLVTPFSGDTPWEIIGQVTKDEPVAPSEKEPGRFIPPELDSIVMKCLEKDRENRYQTVKELKHEVELYLAGRPIDTMEYSLWQVIKKWVGRNRALAASSLAVLLILVVSFAVSYVRIAASEQEALHQRDLAEQQRNFAEEQQKKAEQKEEEARTAQARAEEQRALVSKRRLEAETSELKSRLNLAMVYEEKKDIGTALQHYRRLNEDMQKKNIIVCPYIELYRWRAMYNGGRCIRLATSVSSGGAAFFSASFSPQASLLAVGSSDNTVQLWNPLAGKLRGTIRGHTSPVGALAFSPDGSRLAAGDLRSNLKIWDVNRLTEIITLHDPHARSTIKVAHRSPVTCLAFSPDGATLATGGDEVIKLWDITTGKISRSIWGHLERVRTVEFSPDGAYLASGGDENQVKLWSVEREEDSTILYEHWKPVKKVVFSPTGDVLASASADSTIKLWCMRNNRLVATLQGHVSDVVSLDFSPDGTMLISGGSDNTVRFWDVARQELVAAFPEHRKRISSVAFSPDGRSAASTSADGTVKIWSLKREDMVLTVELDNLEAVHAEFNPDDTTLAVGTRVTGIAPALLVDTATGEITHRLMKQGGSVNCVVFSPDGRTIASVGMNGLLQFADFETREDSASIEVKSGEPVNFLDIVKNTVSDLWTMKHGRSWKKTISSVAFSPDGSILATGSDSLGVMLWDAESRRRIHTFEDLKEVAYCVVFSPDGNLLAAGSNNRLVIWDVRTKQTKADLKIRGIVTSLSFSPDSRLLAYGGSNKTITIRDIEKQCNLSVLQGHLRFIQSVDFSPGGRLLASGGDDTTVRLWDIENGECLLTLNEHTGNVTSVAFSRDGTRLASCSKDHTVKIWKFGESLRRSGLTF